MEKVVKLACDITGTNYPPLDKVRQNQRILDAFALIPDVEVEIVQDLKKPAAGRGGKPKGASEGTTTTATTTSTTVVSSSSVPPPTTPAPVPVVSPAASAVQTPAPSVQAIAPTPSVPNAVPRDATKPKHVMDTRNRSHQGTKK